MIRDAILKMIQQAMRAPAPVQAGANLYADLAFDSLAFIALLLEIEEAYAISFDLLEIKPCLDVDRLVAIVEKKVKERNGDDQALADRPEELG